MGEEENGSSLCPLSKVVGRFMEVPKTINLNHGKTTNINMKTKIRVPLKPKHRASPPRVLSPQEIQTAYKEIIVTFSDALTSATNLWRAMRTIRQR